MGRSCVGRGCIGRISPSGAGTIERERNPLAGENEKLRRELERTEKKLRQAELIIEFQKNLCEILGISPTGVLHDGEN